MKTTLKTACPNVNAPAPAPTQTPARYPRAEALAQFLYDQQALGTPKYRRPKGELTEVMIRRGSLLDGEDFGILVSKKPLSGPLGPANEFWIFTKLAEMAGPTPTRYYGPFDDRILPNE
ncbi:MAG: hypothetical protein IT384_34290 [Deltaproteobacteria bacterium]|nr:hypothetical protein [Deltaproteobacteria bacterium]